MGAKSLSQQTANDYFGTNYKLTYKLLRMIIPRENKYLGVWFLIDTGKKIYLQNLDYYTFILLYL